jgi:hypothetical protein
MIILKVSAAAETSNSPSRELLAALDEYDEALVKAGILLSSYGLQPSTQGARVRFSGDQKIVADGPFTDAKEVITGSWLWRVKSKAEAIEWVKRCPNLAPGGESEIEIRQVY